MFKATPGVHGGLRKQAEKHADPKNFPTEPAYCTVCGKPVAVEHKHAGDAAETLPKPSKPTQSVTTPFVVKGK
jgi:hypothetical protein